MAAHTHYPGPHVCAAFQCRRCFRHAEKKDTGRYRQAFSATYNWKLAHEELKDGFMDTFAKEFKKKLAEKSNGEINLEIYPSGTLGTSEDLVNLVQENVIQFNLADAGHLGSLIPEVQALLLQYLFPKDMDVVKEVLNKGKFMDLLGEKFRQMDLEPLANLTEGWQVWTTNKPIHTPQDFKGFKMRTMTSRLLVENYKAYGCNPTTMPYAEVYSGLQLNMIEGQFNSLNCTSDMKFYEVQKGLYQSRIISLYGSFWVQIRTKVKGSR